MSIKFRCAHSAGR